MKKKILNFYNCLSSGCKACLPFFKLGKSSQNYVSLSSPASSTNENQAKLQSQSFIEATTLIPSQLMGDTSNLDHEITNSVNRNLYGGNEFEKSLEQKTHQKITTIFEKVNESYEGWEKLCEETVKFNKLKMYLKSYVKENKNRVNILRLEYFSPCRAQDFILFQNSVEESRKIMAKHIDTLESYAEYGPENCFKLMHSKYKKILTASPRDFVYMKHFEKVEKEGKVFWVEISESFADEHRPEVSTFVRGEIILSGQIAEDIAEGQCFIRAYMEVDFRLSLPLFLTKTASSFEMRGWVEKCEERIRELIREKEKENAEKPALMNI